MKNRIFKGIFSVSFIILCLTSVILIFLLYDYFSKITADEIKSELNYISEAVEFNGLEYLENLQDSKNRITWIDGEGEIIFDNEKKPEEMENHMDREEVKDAISNGTGESYRYSNTLGEMRFYCARKLSDGTVIRISGSRYNAISLLLDITVPFGVILVISFIVSMIFARGISDKITKPVNEIDLNNIDEIDTYEELTPFIRKISSQNKQINEQLVEMKRKQQEFVTITENMCEGLLVYDKKTDILLYNSSVLKILGAEITEQRQSVFTLNRSDVFIKSVNMALDGDRNENVLKLGERIYQIISNPVYSEGNITGGITLIMDVTEREERENLRREFSANVSHELKTPLTSIYGFAEIMKNGIVKEEDMKRFAGNIFKEAKRLIALVNDIIKISQFDEGQQVSEVVEFDFMALIAENIERLSATASYKDVIIESELESVQMTGVYTVIDEMIYNIIDNAIKYNKKGGKVKVVLKKVENKVCFMVSDTGIGIPYDEQSRVFERFYRVDKSHSKEVGGTGLGLSIVKHGAAMHSAYVDLRSEPGKWTEVEVIF